MNLISYHSSEIYSGELVNSHSKFFTSSCPGIPKGSLDTHLEDLSKIGIKIIYCLINYEEQRKLNLINYSEKTKHLGIEFISLPITDQSIPDPNLTIKLKRILDEMVMNFKKNKTFLIHCKAGLGRTGMITALLLKKFNFTSSEAIKTVRNKKPGSIETKDQEKYVIEFEL